jgi:hypothetical protein
LKSSIACFSAAECGRRGSVSITDIRNFISTPG